VARRARSARRGRGPRADGGRGPRRRCTTADLDAGGERDVALPVGTLAVDRLAALGAQRPFTEDLHEGDLGARIEAGVENDLGSVHA
jgi:hypothetical protein